MGLDLTLLPYCDGENANFSHAMIPVPREKISDALTKIEGLDVVDGFVSFYGTNDDGEPCYGETIETPYGERLQFCRAKQLKPILDGPEGAYVTALEDDHRLALYWH